MNARNSDRRSATCRNGYNSGVLKNWDGFTKQKPGGWPQKEAFERRAHSGTNKHPKAGYREYPELIRQQRVAQLAEREGFEPSMGLITPYSLSRGAPSATRPSLRWIGNSSTDCNIFHQNINHLMGTARSRSMPPRGIAGTPRQPGGRVPVLALGVVWNEAGGRCARIVGSFLRSLLRAVARGFFFRRDRRGRKPARRRRRFPCAFSRTLLRGARRCFSAR